MESASDEIKSLLDKKREALARQIFESDEDDSESPPSHPEPIVDINDDIEALPMKRATALYAAQHIQDTAISTTKKSMAHNIYTSSSSDEDGVIFDDGFDDDLIGGEQDRKYLAAMTEREREQILFQRGVERQQKRERWELRRKLRAERSKQDVVPKREKIQELVSDKNLHKDHKPTSFWGQVKKQTLEDDDISIILPLVRKIQLKRNQFTKWAYRSFFRERLPGLFVRVRPRENVYQLHRIIKIVDLSKPYEIGTEKFCYGYQYQWEGQTKTGSFYAISGTEVSENEYREWIKQCETGGIQKPITLHEANDLVERMNILENQSKGPLETTYMISEKRKFGLLKMNPTQERLFLLRKKEVLLQKQQELSSGQRYDEESSIEEINSELKDVESRLSILDDFLSRREEQKDSKEHDRLRQFELINKRNRELNFKRAHEAELERKKANLNQSSNALDPTARRKTRSTFGDAIAASASPDHVNVAKIEPINDSLHDSKNSKEMIVHDTSHSTIPPNELDNMDINHSQELDDLDIDMDILRKKYGSSSHKKHLKPSNDSLLEKYKKEHGIF